MFTWLISYRHLLLKGQRYTQTDEEEEGDNDNDVHGTGDHREINAASGYYTRDHDVVGNNENDCGDYSHAKEGPDVNNNKDDGGCGWDDHEDSISIH